MQTKLSLFLIFLFFINSLDAFRTIIKHNKQTEFKFQQNLLAFTCRRHEYNSPCILTLTASVLWVSHSNCQKRVYWNKNLIMHLTLFSSFSHALFWEIPTPGLHPYVLLHENGFGLPRHLQRTVCKGQNHFTSNHFSFTYIKSNLLSHFPL